MSSNISESILQKRIKRFKSMKRGYYSLIILIIFYFISLLGPLWMNNKPLIIKYDNNYYFPAIMDFIDFIPGVNYPLYESKTFNQNINSIEADFRLLDKQTKNDKGMDELYADNIPNGLSIENASYIESNAAKTALTEKIENIPDSGLSNLNEEHTPQLFSNETESESENNLEEFSSSGMDKLFDQSEKIVGLKSQKIKLTEKLSML